MLTGFNNQCEQIGKEFFGKGSSKKEHTAKLDGRFVVEKLCSIVSFYPLK